MRMGRTWAVTVLVLGWGPRLAGAQAAPSPPPPATLGMAGDYEVRANQTYLRAGGVLLKLDLYVPRAGAAPRPTVFYIHGGGWMAGTKESESLALLPYVERGFTAVNVEYRLAGQALAPAAVEDCRCALRWVVRNAAKHKVDPSKIVVTGNSAGGHLALMTGLLPVSARLDDECATLEPGSWSSAPLPELPVAAVVNWYGITDVTDMLPGAPSARGYALEWFAGVPAPEALARRLSPLTWVRAGVPPVITVHGDADKSVPYDHAVRLHKALDAAGVPNRLLTVPGGGHGGFTLAERQKAFAAIEDFLGERGLMP